MEFSAWVAMTCYVRLSCFPFPWDPGRKSNLRIQHCSPRSCTRHRLGHSLVWISPFPQQLPPDAVATGWWSLAPGRHMVELLALCPLTRHGSRRSGFDISFIIAEIVNYKTLWLRNIVKFCDVHWHWASVPVGWQRNDVLNALRNCL